MIRNIDNVQTIKLINGAELITTSIEFDSIENSYTCKEVMGLTVGPDGNPTIVPFIATSGVPSEQTCNFDKTQVCYYGQTDADIATIYLGALTKSDQMIGRASVITETPKIII